MLRQHADRVRIDGDVTPAEKGLSLADDGMLDDAFAALTLALLLGQEHHAGAVLATVRQVDIEGGALLLEELVRHLDQQAGAVAGAWVSATGAAMAEVDQHL